MGVARTTLTALLLSAWVMIHAVFIANSPQEQLDEDRLLPLRIPSVFRMPWFRAFVETHMDVKLLRFSPEKKHASPSFWVSLARRGGTDTLSSSRSLSRSASEDDGEHSWLRPLAWLVTAMTMAELVTVSYLLWAILWKTLLRPLLLVLFVLALLLGAFYAVKGYFFVVAPALFQEEAPSVPASVVAVDAYLHKAAGALWGLQERALYLVDRFLAVLVTPSSVLEEQKAQAARGAASDAGTPLAALLEAARRTLYAALTGDPRTEAPSRSRADAEL
ncbi:hypothetical protein BESB_040790 [Besnoitia besnoiti]|uniref:Transmembrane protein n=1 Tax=Besnoitia besnoiti TaxID=94643 RepID=A0A2A9MMG8_BESBE|nr:hypothetical protein BESB_040790 [Besnoitia besnoiti]PFH37621.1 hypothetical protein BESB_040790 [Besnoitia besnoiti]